MIVKNGRLEVEKAYVKDGYIIVENLKPAFTKKYKVFVTKDKHAIYYDVHQKAILPLQFGNGRYLIKLFECKITNRYINIGSVSVDVKLSNPNAPYLHPNQYVNYTEKSPCVKKAKEICVNCVTPEEKFNVISKYVVDNMRYDFIKEILAAKKSNVLPSIDECFKKRLGICQDIAAIMVAMLRSQNVPASLIVGTCDGKLHAWVKVYFKNENKVFDPTAIILNKKNIKSYKTERWY